MESHRSLLTIEELESIAESASARSAAVLIARLLEERPLSPIHPERIMALLDPLIAAITKRLAEYRTWIEGESAPPSFISKSDRDHLRYLMHLTVNRVVAACSCALDLQNATEMTHTIVRCASALEEPSLEATGLNLRAMIYEILGNRLQAIELHEAALGIVRGTSDIDSIAQTLYALAQLRNGMGQREEALELCRQSVDLLEGLPGGEEALAGALKVMGMCLNGLGRQSEAMAAFTRALEIVESHDLYPTMIGTLYLLSALYLDLGEPRQALAFAMRQAEIASRNRFPFDESAAHLQIGHIHTMLGELPNARRFLERAFAIVGPTDNVVLTTTLHRRLGELHMAEEDYDGAEREYRRALELGSNMREQTHNFSLRMQLADCAFHRGDHASALERCLSIVNEAGDTGTGAGPSQLHYRIGKIYEAQGETEKAFEHYHRSLGLSGSGPVVASVHERLAGLLAGQGRYQKALEHFNRFHELSVADARSRSERDLSNLRVLHEIDQMKYETELERLRRTQIESELTVTRTELTGAAVALTDKSELIHTIERRIRRALEGPDSGLPHLEKAMRTILNDISTHESAKNRALRYLRSVDDRFYDGLRGRHPELTMGQVRLCALIRAGLSSDEISQVLHINADTLKKQRKRLRKRIGLEQRVKLEGYLAGV